LGQARLRVAGGEPAASLRRPEQTPPSVWVADGSLTTWRNVSPWSPIQRSRTGSAKIIINLTGGPCLSAFWSFSFPPYWKGKCPAEIRLRRGLLQFSSVSGLFQNRNLKSLYLLNYKSKSSVYFSSRSQILISIKSH
jgi:hypothetical protein